MKRLSVPFDASMPAVVRSAAQSARIRVPVVLVVGPYRFGFYALDRGERPHVHVRGGGGHAKLWLQPVEQWDRFFGDN